MTFLPGATRHVQLPQTFTRRSTAEALLPPPNSSVARTSCVVECLGTSSTSTLVLQLVDWPCCIAVKTSRVRVVSARAGDKSEGAGREGVIRETA